MLPQPATAYRSKSRHGNSNSISSSFFSAGSASVMSSVSHSLLDRLRMRARLTNLAVSLILGAFALSMLANLNFWLLQRESASWTSGSRHGVWTGELTRRPSSIESTIQRPPELQQLEHMVVVAGHAIWTGSDASRHSDDSDWILTPFQRGGSVNTFYKHIEAGAKIVKEDPTSLLVFSGGQTRPDNPPNTEAQSYHRLAVAAKLVTSTPNFLRATTEDFALDSYENLLFSLARFKEVTGRWPERVTVVGFEMKRARFENLHRVAIKYPADRFQYIGIDDEGDTTDSYEGEYQYGFLPFQDDMYGCLPPLSTKRTARNPFARYHPYHTSCPEIAGLLEFCSPQGKPNSQAALYPAALPWETRDEGADGTRWGREN